MVETKVPPESSSHLFATRCQARAVSPVSLLQQTLVQNSSSLLEIVSPDDFRRPVSQAVADLLKCVARHVRTSIASAGFSRGSHDSGNRDVRVLRRGLL